ncbi:MAG: hypothetical protein ACKPKO_31025, partial [Candidatus Fonsibacter sp.]
AAKSAESSAFAESPASSVNCAAPTIFGTAYPESLAVAGSTVGGSVGHAGGGSGSGLTDVLHGHSSSWLTMYLKVSAHLIGTEAFVGFFSK